MIAAVGRRARTALRLAVVAPLAAGALAAGALAGCGSIPDTAGAVAGITAGGISSNPLVAYAVGLGVRAVTEDVVRRVDRRLQAAEQREVAAAIGAAAPGQARPWRVEHGLPLIGDAGGEVRVTRVVENPLAACKEALFSVEAGEGAARTREWFTTTACEGDGGWRWAAAEPAVARWGSLH